MKKNAFGRRVASPFDERSVVSRESSERERDAERRRVGSFRYFNAYKLYSYY